MADIEEIKGEASVTTGEYDGGTQKSSETAADAQAGMTVHQEGQNQELHNEDQDSVRKEASGSEGQNNNSETKKGKKKKHKGLKIALIAILTVIVILGALFAYVYSTQKVYVQNKWAMITKNDTEYFRWVMDRNIARVEEEFAEKTAKTKDLKQPEEWSDKGKISVSLKSELGQLFLGKNFAGIKDAGLKYELSSNKDKNFGALITPFYKNVELLDVAGVIDAENGKTYLALPSYKPEAIELSSWLDKVSEEKNIDFDISNIIDLDDLKKKLDEFKGSMDADKLDKLIHVIYDEIDEATLEKNVALSISGMEAEVNVLSGKLSKEKCDKIIKAYVDEIFDAAFKLIPDINVSGLLGNDILNGVIGKDGDSSIGSIGSLLGDISGGSLGDSLGSILGGSIINDLGKSALEKVIANAKESVLKKISEYSISIEFSIYVDAKGDIVGGMIKLAANETKIKLDALSLKDKDNPEKKQCGIDATLNGIKLANILCNTEKKDGRKYFDVTIKPGSVVEMVLKGASTYELKIKGSISDPNPGSNDIDLDVRLTSPDGEVASIILNNVYTGGNVSMPIDISGNNVIDIMDFPDSDYIDLGTMLKPIVGRLEEINDEGLNNFLSNFLKEQLGITDFDVPELKKMIESGMIDAGNSIVKDRLKKMLGIEPPYDYSSLSEKPKESEDGNYVLSWDNYQDAPVESIYSSLSVKVYDYYQKLDEFEPDLETEKNKFLSSYLGQSYQREAADDEGIEMGDEVVFDVVPVLGSMVIESYAYPNEKTTIGSYDYGEGIDDQLLGVKKGETRDLTLTLDDRYGAFAGYTGVFRITIKQITKVTKPEWSEAFIVGQLGYDSVEALEAELMEKAQQNYDELAAQYAPSGQGLTAIMIDQVLIGIDSSSCGIEAEESAKKYQESLSAIAGPELSDIYKAAGYSDEEILKLMGVDKSIPDYAVRRRIMDEAVAKTENISMLKSVYDNNMNLLAEALGYSDGDAFMAAVGNKYGQRFFVDMFIDREVTAVLLGKTEFDWS